MTSLRPGGKAVVIVRAIRGLSGAVASLLVHPTLVWEALRAFASVRGRSGLVPPPDYLRWRLVTAYGAFDHPIDPGDLIAFLQWRRVMRALSRGASLA